MSNPRLHARSWVFLLLAVSMVPVLVGCGPSYRELRMDGQRVMVRGEFGPAYYLFEMADQKRRNQVLNLHDMGFCGVMLARQRFDHINYAAAMLQLDRSIECYNRAIDAHPGHQASLVGKNIALELMGQFEEALEHAEWAAKFVGPSARQHLFLAEEFEQRGDVDAALLRYRQAVAMEPRNATAHTAIARFLLKHNNENSAVWHLQQAYRLNPRNRWVSDQLQQRGKVPPLAPADHAATQP